MPAARVFSTFFYFFLLHVALRKNSRGEARAYYSKRFFPSPHVKVEKSRKVEKVDLAPAHVKRGSRKKILTMLNEA